MKAIRVYDTCAHSHVINSNLLGIHSEKNAKKIGKTRIEEKEIKAKEELKPKGQEGWYGKLPSDKYKEILNPRKSKADRQAAANKYIFEGK
jgi:hypothetical protein